MAIVWFIIGYLSGSISSAILICRLLGHGDPRAVGSGNPGTTNVLRHFGKFAAASTLVGDVAKGFVPVTLAQVLGFDQSAVALAGIGAFTGHLYPVFFGFAGGKGVATLIGVLLGFHPPLGIAFMGSWLLIAAISRYSSLAALTATATAPLIAHLMGVSMAVTLSVGAMGVLVFWRHQSNIRKLLGGTEDKIGGSRAKS